MPEQQLQSRVGQSKKIQQRSFNVKKQCSSDKTFAFQRQDRQARLQGVQIETVRRPRQVHSKCRYSFFYYFLLRSICMLDILLTKKISDLPEQAG